MGTPNFKGLYGIWTDDQGNPHISIPQALKELELEDTPENRRAVMAIFVKECAKASPDAVQIYTAKATQSYGITFDGKAIFCHRCRNLSYNPSDVKYKYCGFCQQFHHD
jgi:ribosomal protein L37E